MITYNTNQLKNKTPTIDFMNEKRIKLFKRNELINYYEDFKKYNTAEYIKQRLNTILQMI